MPWYYYNAVFGPGHQSSSDGFAHIVPEDWGDLDNSQVLESLSEHFACLAECDHTSYSIKFWEVDAIPVNIKTELLETESRRIEDALESILMISKSPVTVVPEETNLDEEISEAIRGRPNCLIIEALHKAGFLVTLEQLGSWCNRYPKSTLPNNNVYMQPAYGIKNKVLKTILSVKRYGDDSQKTQKTKSK